MRQFVFIVTAVLLILIWGAEFALAAWVATDNFNSYADGDLTGSNGGTGWSAAWNGNVCYDVQGTTVNEGAKAIQHVSCADEAQILRDLTTAVASGIMRIAVRRADKTNFLRITMRDTAANTIMYVDIENSANNCIRFGNNNACVVNNYNVNQWYVVHFFIDTAANAHKIRVDDGDWSTTSGDFSAGAGDVSRLVLISQGAVNNTYWDDIREGSEPPAPVVPFNFPWWFFFFPLGNTPLFKKVTFQ